MLPPSGEALRPATGRAGTTGSATATGRPGPAAAGRPGPAGSATAAGRRLATTAQPHH
jgi:hypothetical protein